MSKVIVVYGGGFQPFHVGHLSSYLEAKHAFPNADFYVVASNDTKTRPIPFKEKQWLATQAGVSEKDFRNLAVKSPLNPVEILNQYDPNTDIFILVRSERDPMSYTKKDGSPAYYQPFASLDKCNTFGKNGYVFVTRKKDFVLNGQVVYSGTQVRDMYARSDDKVRMEIIDGMYPKSKHKETIKKMLDMYLGDISEPISNTSNIKKLKNNPLKENILKIIKDARPLLKEASVEQKIKLMKLIKESMATLDEARLFQPQYVNLYIVSPEDSRVRKKINVNIAFNDLDRYVKALLQRYPGLDVSELRYKAASNEPYQYGERLEEDPVEEPMTTPQVAENPDYLEEK